jgi:hypothetical protein
LRLFKLREGSRSIRCVATCCHCTLAVDHMAYQGNVVMVPRDACHLNGAEHVPLTMRIQVDTDLPLFIDNGGSR